MVANATFGSDTSSCRSTTGGLRFLNYQDVDKQKKSRTKKDYEGHEGSGILACFVFLSASGLELDAT